MLDVEKHLISIYYAQVYDTETRGSDLALCCGNELVQVDGEDGS